MLVFLKTNTNRVYSRSLMLSPRPLNYSQFFSTTIGLMLNFGLCIMILSSTLIFYEPDLSLLIDPNLYKYETIKKRLDGKAKVSLDP